jgi:HEAT repeat protein
LAAAFALARLGDAAGLVRLEQLAKAKDVNGHVYAVIQELRADAVPILRKVIQEDCVGTSWAIETLGEIGASSAPAVQDLIKVLQSGRAGNRRFRFDAAIVALHKIGTGAGAALPILKEALTTETNPDVRSHLQDAISAIELSPATQPAHQ